MDAESFFSRILEAAGESILAINDADWQKPTPCTEWDLKFLVRHMVYELVWIPDLLAGMTVAEVGSKYEGDILGDNPIEAWRTAVEGARESISTTDADTVVHLSMGDAPAAEYINEVAADIAIHGWDVAKSLSLSYELNDEILDGLDLILPALDKKYSQYNVFGKPLEVDDSVSRQTKLLAALGRKA